MSKDGIRGIQGIFWRQDCRRWWRVSGCNSSIAKRGGALLIFLSTQVFCSLLRLRNKKSWDCSPNKTSITALHNLLLSELRNVVHYLLQFFRRFSVLKIFVNRGFLSAAKKRSFTVLFHGIFTFTGEGNLPFEETVPGFIQVQKNWWNDFVCADWVHDKEKREETISEVLMPFKREYNLAIFCFVLSFCFLLWQYWDRI